MLAIKAGRIVKNMNGNPATIQDIDDRFDRFFERLKELFVTKDDLRQELNKLEDRLSDKITGSIENTISETADEILIAVHDRFDIVEDQLDRIEDRLDRHLAV